MYKTGWAPQRGAAPHLSEEKVSSGDRIRRVLCGLQVWEVTIVQEDFERKFVSCDDVTYPYSSVVWFMCWFVLQPHFNSQLQGFGNQSPGNCFRHPPITNLSRTYTFIAYSDVPSVFLVLIFFLICTLFLTSECHNVTLGLIKNSSLISKIAFNVL